MKNEKVSNTLDDGLRTQCKGSANTVLSTHYRPWHWAMDSWTYRPGVIDNRWYDEKRHNGPITSVTYQYMMNRHWGLGATASLLYYNKKMVYSDTGETADKMSETALALMFTTRYYWRTKNWVRVYSSASVGFGYDWEKKYKTWKGNDSQKVIFCGQISPLGIEVGKYRLIGFGELGLGMTGWFRAGIGYRF